MPADELHQALLAIDDLRLRPGEPLAHHLPLRVGGSADLWAVADTLPALRKALKAARAHKVKWRLHWPFQDWVVRDARLSGLTVRPGAGFEGLERSGEHLILGAATPWAALAGLGQGWWSELASWPGCPGATLTSGHGDRLLGMLKELSYFRGRGVSTVEIDSHNGVPSLPRTAVLLSVTLQKGLLLYDGDGDPRPPAAGQLFADPEVAGRVRSAGKLLVDADIAGTRLRSWQLAREAPGTVVNLGGGTARDLHLLGLAVSARMEKFNGIKLTTRIPVKGTDTLAPRRPIRRR